MKLSSFQKMLFSYLLFVLISCLGIRIIMPPIITNNLMEENAEDIYCEATDIASSENVISYMTDYSGDLAELSASLTTMSAYPHGQIWVIDPSGLVLLNTDPSSSSQSQLFIPDFETLSLDSSYYQVGTFHRSFTEKTLSVLAPVISDYQTLGYIAVHYPLSHFSSEQSSALTSCYITALIILLLSSLLILAVYIIFYRPLKLTLNTAGEFANGNLNCPVPYTDNSEFGQLCTTMKDIAGALGDSGETRRDLISNISHDLRSPLTSIMGYVEAILDKTIPPEMQERYLKIVLSEAERLNRLANSLLTLSQYDDQKFVLEYSSFDINTLLRETAVSFEVLCTSREITIRLNTDEPQMMVYADREKIHQVVYNLLDNAIKFSHDSSDVDIDVTSRKNKVLVSIKDSGIGIAKENIAKIWDRFYKTDRSRGRNKNGTGLGLAIVKEIIQAHGESVDVISTLDEGSDFVFTLTRTQAQEE